MKITRPVISLAIAIYLIFCPSAAASAQTPRAQAHREYYQEGVEAARKGDYEFALERFRLVLRAVPTHPYSNYLAALCSFRLGDLDQAIAYLQEALKRRPDWERAEEMLEQLQNRRRYDHLNDGKRGGTYFSLSNNFRIEVPAGWSISDSYYPSRGQVKALVAQGAECSFIPYISINRILLKERRGTDLDLLTSLASVFVDYLKNFSIRGRYNIPVGTGSIAEVIGEGILEIGDDGRLPVSVSMTARRFGNSFVVASAFCASRSLDQWKGIIETSLYSLALISNEEDRLGAVRDGKVDISRLNVRLSLPPAMKVIQPEPGEGGLLRFKTVSGDVELFIDPISYNAFRAEPDSLHEHLAPLVGGRQAPEYRYLTGLPVPAVILVAREPEQISAGFARFDEGFMILQGTAGAAGEIEKLLKTMTMIDAY